MVGRPRQGVLAAGRLALVLPLLALLACNDSPSEPADRTVLIATVVEQSFSGVQIGRDEVIVDDNTWARVWEEIHAPMSPRPALPAVDFGREMLLLAALGMRVSGCYSVRIVAVEEAGSGLRAAIEEKTPGTSCACGGALTHPVHVVRLPRHSGPVSFVYRSTRLRC